VGTAPGRFFAFAGVRSRIEEEFMAPLRVLAIGGSLLAVAVSIGCRDSVAPASPIMIQVVAAGLYTCGLTGAQAAYCWGDNSSGQLGRAAFGYSGVPVAVEPF